MAAAIKIPKCRSTQALNLTSHSTDSRRKISITKPYKLLEPRRIISSQKSTESKKSLANSSTKSETGSITSPKTSHRFSESTKSKDPEKSSKKPSPVRSTIVDANTLQRLHLTVTYEPSIISRNNDSYLLLIFSKLHLN